MQVALENNIVFVVIEYLAILCWGLSGGLAAIRKGYDIFTIMLCGWLTALGGGLVRDVMLGALPPVGITDKGYVLTTLFSGIIVVVAHPEITKLKWTMTVIDALGLGLFAVSGTAKALAYGSSGMTAVFLGMFTALDGASHIQIFTKIILPITKPALAVVGMFAFLNSWNDFLSPLVYLNSEKKYTVALGLQLFTGSYRGEWNLMMAAACLVLAPVVVVDRKSTRLNSSHIL